MKPNNYEKTIEEINKWKNNRQELLKSPEYKRVARKHLRMERKLNNKGKFKKIAFLSLQWVWSNILSILALIVAIIALLKQ